ncbi:recombinase family protein [Aromatoleum aromaticum]|uniref:Site-specific recombinase/DNA invertase n=1 Tax=Aromatoleum aromaticum (strain DSM 19018 / LMG 30748 / EbN1) TaxID=76114 RepID=Q5P670_AROAE|nr:recombinase family protein [Aromatoleum aromaticum]CAI07191.1 site-specific recombinase/DNA invertase [Aromatoleum aromaticum EbN1]
MYVRVSTSNQVHQQTIDQQLDRLRAHLQAQDLTLTDQNIYRDDGFSGARLNRPGLDHLRDAIRERSIDRVVLTAPDRLARNYVHQMLLLEEFEEHGCQVEFLDRPMSQDPHDQLLLQIRGAVAEYERTLITERMRRGRQAKLRAGVLLPWTRAPYGYRLHPDRPRDPGGVVLEPGEAAVVAEIFALYLEPQVSLLQLARTLAERHIPSPGGKSVWAVATLHGILTNPAYTGQVYTGRVRYRPPRIRRSATHPIGRPHESRIPVPRAEWIAVATVPAIVATEQFDLVQSKLAKNRCFSQRNNTAHPYLLRALVSCGYCRYACIGRTAVRSPYSYYMCSSKLKWAMLGREPCHARFAPAGQLDDLVWRDLCEVLTHPAELTRALERAHGGQWLPQELQARRENLRQGRVSLGQQIDRLTEAYLHDVIALPEYERRRRDLEQRDQALAEQERQLSAQADRHEELAGTAIAIENFCARVRAGLDNASFEQKRQLVELLIDRVIVTDTAVEIHYVIPTDRSSEHVRFCHLRTDYLDGPVGTHRAGQFLGREHARADVEALLELGRLVADEALRDNATDRLAPRPQRGVDFAAAGHGPTHLQDGPTVAAFDVLEARAGCKRPPLPRPLTLAQTLSI